MTTAPRVTVVMAAYNAAAHIGTAMECLSRQTMREWELVVVDDGSCDDTRRVVESFRKRDARIAYHRMPRNSGPAAARNIGFASARGEWITVLDSDDRYEPDRLRVLLERATISQADIVADNLGLFDEAVGKVISQGFSFKGDSMPLTPRRLVENDGPPRLASLGHLKPFIRADFWRESEVVYPEDVRIGEDFYFLFRLLQKTKRAILLNYVGYLYTLPYSAVSGRLATGTRTDYGFDSLDGLSRINDMLADHAGRAASSDPHLHAVLLKRGKRLRHEGTWRRTKHHLKSNEFLSVTALLPQMDIPFIWEQISAIAKRWLGRHQTVLR